MEPGEGSRLGKPWRRGILIPQDLELSLELFSEVRKGSAAPALGGGSHGNKNRGLYARHRGKEAEDLRAGVLDLQTRGVLWLGLRGKMR